MQSITVLILAAAFFTAIALALDESDEQPQAVPYKYEYGVDDPHTKDQKMAWEKSDGHNVVGGYKLSEADGTQRNVEYESNGKGGTNIIVERIGHAFHPDHEGHPGEASSYANFRFPHKQEQ